MKKDVKFIAGMIVMAAVLLLMAGGFWTMVARQAELDRIQERTAQESARKSIVLKSDGELKYRIFLDMASREVFEADIPSEGIYNSRGVLIQGDELLYGDIVRIYGDNELTGEGIPYYPGITRMERVSRADLEEAERYQRIADEVLSSGNKALD